MNKTLSTLLRFGLFILLVVYVYPYVIEYVITPKEKGVALSNPLPQNRIEKKDSIEKDKIEISEEEIIKRLNDSIDLLRNNIKDSLYKEKRINDSLRKSKKNKARIKNLREKLNIIKTERNNVSIEDRKKRIEKDVNSAIKTMESIMKTEITRARALGHLDGYVQSELNRWYKNKFMEIWRKDKEFYEKAALAYYMTVEEYKDFETVLISNYFRDKGDNYFETKKINEEKINEEKINEEFLVRACLEAFVKNENMNHFKEDISDDFCNCFAKKVLKKFNKKELSDLEYSVNNSSEKFIDKAYFLSKDYRIKNLVEECFGNIELDDESYIELNPEKKQAFIKQCKEDYITGMSSREIKELSYVFNLDGYCDCLTVKMTKEFSASELLDFNDNIPNRNRNNKNLNKLTKMAEDCASKNIY